MPLYLNEFPAILIEICRNYKLHNNVVGDQNKLIDGFINSLSPLIIEGEEEFYPPLALHLQIEEVLKIFNSFVENIEVENEIKSILTEEKEKIFYYHLHTQKTLLPN